MAMPLVDSVCVECGHESQADADDLRRLGALMCEECGSSMGFMSDDMDPMEIGIGERDDGHDG